MCLPPTERDWLKLTPRQFELLVVEELRKLGQPLVGLKVEHQSPVSTPEGEFAIDALATFKALGGDYLVLVECKHHKNPIKREVIQVLADKLASTHAQKAMVFSTARFQSGAIEYAAERHIALILMTPGGPVFETRGRFGPEGPPGPPEAYWATVRGDGAIVYHYGGYDDLSAFVFDRSS